MDDRSLRYMQNTSLYAESCSSFILKTLKAFLSSVFTHTHSRPPPPLSPQPPNFHRLGKDRSNDNFIHTGKVLLVFFSFEIVSTDLSELVLERRRHLRLGFVLKGPSLPQICFVQNVQVDKMTTLPQSLAMTSTFWSITGW